MNLFRSRSRREFLTAAGVFFLVRPPPIVPTAAIAAPPGNGGNRTSRDLISDPHFCTGFHLLQPKPGRRVPYGTLTGARDDVAPSWDLCQWSSRFPLAAESPAIVNPKVRRWSNPGKAVTLGEPGTPEADLTLAVNAGVEYNGRARQAKEPWVHLLVQQRFADPPRLARLSSARLHLQARLLRSTFQRTHDYSPSLHAAQFQLFLTLQNVQRASAGFGQLVWFGVPLYDDRSRFPKEHKAQDTGGTSMFIYAPDGAAFSDRSAHDREWITVDRELLPLFLAALEAAWRQGFLRESGDLADYAVSGLNLGWEVPGLFDVEMQVRNLRLPVALS